MASSPDFRTFNPQKLLWRFAECEFDELRFQLSVQGQPVELERKPLELLRYLLAHSCEVVRKEELLEAIWPGVLVVDASLATAVSKLRKALGDQEIVQTVPRVGYRIAVPVVRLTPPDSTTEAIPEAPSPLNTASPPLQSQHPPALSSRRLLWAGSAIAAVLLVSIGLIGSRSRKAPSSPQPASVAILPFQNVSGNQSLDYLRSALPDEIAHTFASAKSLNVRPLAASARFNVPAVDFKKLGRDLDVNRAIADTIS